MDPSEDVPQEKVKQKATPFHLLSKNEQLVYITERVKKNKIGELEPLVKDSQDLFDHLISEMSTNKNAKRAAEIIAKYNKDPDNYPVLMNRLQKKSVRYIVSEQPWSMVEHRLKNKPELMVIAIEEYFFKGDKQVVMSLIKRYPLAAALITKEDLKAWLETEEAKGFEELSNDLSQKDEFGPWKGPQGMVVQPIDSHSRLITLESLGIKEEDIIIIDKLDQLDDLFTKLKAETRLGIDIETVPCLVKFEDSAPSLLQIATLKKIYIVDLLSKDADFERIVFDRFIKEICDNDKILKVGQGLDNDIRTLKKRFDIKDKIVSSS